MKHIDIQPGAKVGRKNGLSILLDTETFDYSFHLKASEGKKLNHLNEAFQGFSLLIHDFDFNNQDSKSLSTIILINQ